MYLSGYPLNGIAQEKSNKEKRGDKYYFTYSFNKAIDCYTEAKHLSVDGQRKLAKSYQSENKDSLSEIAYAKLVNTSGGTLPEDYYNYAMVLKDNSKYAEADTYMNKFVALKNQLIYAQKTMQLIKPHCPLYKKTMVNTV